MLCLCKNQMEEVKINKIPFLKCKNCGLLLKIKRVSLEEEKKRYDCHQIDDKYKEYMTTMYNRIKKYLKRGDTLDFGCGKTKMLAECMKVDRRACDSYDLFYFPQKPTKLYDSIVLIEVFEHLKCLDGDIKEILSYLKIGGHLIILTKPYQEENLEDWWYLRDITHVTFVQRDTFSYWKWNLKLIVQEGDIFVLERI